MALEGHPEGARRKVSVVLLNDVECTPERLSCWNDLTFGRVDSRKLKKRICKIFGCDPELAVENTEVVVQTFFCFFQVTLSCHDLAAEEVEVQAGQFTFTFRPNLTSQPLGFLQILLRGVVVALPGVMEREDRH